MDRRYLARILRRERGDDARPIDAKRREGLQIRLDASAARRIRAGDRDGDRRRCRRIAPLQRLWGSREVSAAPSNDVPARSSQAQLLLFSARVMAASRLAQ